MNKEGVYQFLKEKGINFGCIEHKAVYNMAELAEIELPYPEAEAKNLFVRDDKKRCYYLITVKGDKRVDLKKFQHENGTRRLSFASDEDLYQILGLTPGSVSPFGLFNDIECKTAFYIDIAFFEENSMVAVHPNDNAATVWLGSRDLVKLIAEHGNEVHEVHFE